jgi:hypothetical protein
MRKTEDKDIGFKRVFMKIAKDYIEDPTDRKQAKLKTIVTETLQKDPNLLMWFNAMFTWRNTKFGIDLHYRIKPNIPS